MLILGLDPGSLCTGYGLIDAVPGRLQYRRSGCLRPPRGAGLPQRLIALAEALGELLRAERPDAVALESAFVGRHARPALVLGQARGALIVSVLGAGLPLFEYAPRLVKLAVVGAGGATKPQVGSMVRCLLEAAPARLTTDESDALAVAVCHANRASSIERGLLMPARTLGGQR
jgi:crossover junction endodeoxyribonuclease RuvC